ncbi:MAG: hypothetical protein L0H41_13910 [Microlunatus sp.]|nr:hypothetical protein [Microlunatus sp.]MDN5770419.1 hypothetical protein [Microlunatus sp.]
MVTSTEAGRRLDLHNTSVDTAAARAGSCGFVHLDSGWFCELPHRHEGSCQFADPRTGPEPAAGPPSD